MISNVNLNASAHYKNVQNQTDGKTLAEKAAAAAGAADKIEISADAKSAVQSAQPGGRTPASQYFMEVFSVNFWSRGVSEAYEMALEAVRASIVADSNDLKYFESLVGETLTEDYAKTNFLIEGFTPETAPETVSTVDIKAHY